MNKMGIAILFLLIGCQVEKQGDPIANNDVNGETVTDKMIIEGNFDIETFKVITGLWWHMKLSPDYVLRMIDKKENYGRESWGDYLYIQNMEIHYPNGPGIYFIYNESEKTISIKSGLQFYDLSRIFSRNIVIKQINDLFNINTEQASLSIKVISDNVIKLRLEYMGQNIDLGTGGFGTNQDAEGFAVFYRAAGPGKPYVIWEDGTFDPIKDYDNFTRGMRDASEN